MSGKKSKWKVVGVVGLAVAGAAVGGLIGVNWDVLTAGGIDGLMTQAETWIAEKVGPNVLLVIMSCAGLLTVASPAWANMLGRVTAAVASLTQATQGVLGTDANGKRLLADFAEQSAAKAEADEENRRELAKLKEDNAALAERFRTYMTDAEARESALMAKLDWLLRIMAEQAKGTGELVRNGTARHIDAMSEKARKEEGDGLDAGNEE